MRAARHRAVLVVLAMLALLGWAAPTASAGGPTSVLLVNVADGRTASAHINQSTYDQIWQAFDQGLGPAVTSGMPSANSTEVRLTWLIHDVTPWRLDSVVRVGSDLWVQTQTDMTGTGSLWDAPAVWHRVTGADATAMDDLLGGLGVTGPATAGSGSSGPVAAPPRATTPEPAVDEGVLTGWRLAVVAALVGAALGLFAGRIGSARARRGIDGRLDPLPQ